MKSWILLLAVLAWGPSHAEDNVAERGAKATGKAAERPRGATQKYLEKSGKKIDKATSGK